MCVFMYPGIIGVRLPLSTMGTMASQGEGSKDTVESAIGDADERVSMSLPIYEDTNLFINNDRKIKWLRHHRE